LILISLSSGLEFRIAGDLPNPTLSPCKTEEGEKRGERRGIHAGHGFSATALPSRQK
jgi:hypothetical protein